MFQCPSCSSYNDRSAAFCAQCGNRLLEREHPRPPAPIESPPASRAPWIAPWIVAAICLFGLALTYLVWTLAPSTPSVEPESERSARGGDVPDGPRASMVTVVETSEPRGVQPAVETQLEPLDFSELRDVARRIYVAVDLFDRDGRKIATTEGAIVSPVGTILVRFEPLLGAVRGVGRVESQRESYDVAGAVRVDEARDLALLRLASPREGAVFPAVPAITAEDAHDVFTDGFEPFVAAAKSSSVGRLETYPYFGPEGVARIRLAEDAALPRDPLFALDEFGFFVGLCRREEPLFDGQRGRVLIDPLGALGASVEARPGLSLADITARFYAGTFAALVEDARRAHARRAYGLAFEALFAAFDRAVVERIAANELEEPERLLDRVADGLRAKLGGAGAYAELLGYLERLVERRPRDRALWVEVAELRLRREDFDGAIRAAREALILRAGRDLDALLATAYLALAERFSFAGDLAGASDILIEGIEVVPSSALMHFELAKIYEAWEYFDDAIRLFRAAAQLDARLATDVELHLERIDAAIKRRQSIVVKRARGSEMFRTRALVNGAVNLDFLIDTGATYTAISGTMAANLGIDLRRAQKVAVSTANGKVLVPLVVLDSVSLQGFEVRNVKAFVLEKLRDEGGLLGLNFLDHFKYTFDTERGELLLVPR